MRRSLSGVLQQNAVFSLSPSGPETSKTVYFQEKPTFFCIENLGFSEETQPFYVENKGFNLEKLSFT